MGLDNHTRPGPTQLSLRHDPDADKHILTLTGPDTDGLEVQVEYALDIDAMDLLIQLQDMTSSVVIDSRDLHELETELFDQILHEIGSGAEIAGEPIDPDQINSLTFGVDHWDNGWFPSSQTLQLYRGHTPDQDPIDIELITDEIESIDSSDNHLAFIELAGPFRHNSAWQLTLHRSPGIAA